MNFSDFINLKIFTFFFGWIWNFRLEIIKKFEIIAQLYFSVQYDF